MNMVKPVVLDFDYKVQNAHPIRNSEPELSFISILNNTIQNNEEPINGAYTQKDTTTARNDTTVPLKQMKNNNDDSKDNKDNKDNKEKKYDAGQEISLIAERIIADRRNAKKDDMNAEKSGLIQSFSGALLHKNKNNIMAIVTDKNTHTPKQRIYKKDAFHTHNQSGTYSDYKQNFITDLAITKKTGKETIQDSINQLQKGTSVQDLSKNLKKSDLKQLIARLTTFEHIDKKDVHSAIMTRPLMQYKELLDSKNKKVVRKTDNDAQQVHANNTLHKTVKTEISFLDAVKQKERAEDAPKIDKKGASERNDSLIEVNTKPGNARTNETVVKPVNNDQLMQLLNRAKVMQEGERFSLSLKLYPESLGKLTVNLGLEHGILSGRFIVESQDAKELLMQQLELVRFELEQNGVQVGEFEVNVKEHRQREFTQIQGLSRAQNIENAEYETASNRYIYHDGLLDVII